MPAHIGVLEKLKIPLNSLLYKCIKLAYVADPDNIRRPPHTSMKHFEARLEQVRQMRQKDFSDYVSFRHYLDLYTPDDRSSQEAQFDWSKNLAKGAFIDELIEESFKLQTITKGSVICRKSEIAPKRIEVYRESGAIEIIWSHS